MFGVDLVWDGAQPWVVEVNPRPVASLETIDAAHGVRSFAAHLEGCAGRLPAPAGAPSVAAGKAVLFATEDLRVPGHERLDGPRDPRRAPPRRGDRGRPPDLHADRDGPSPEAVLAELEARAAALRAELQEVGVDAVA